MFQIISVDAFVDFPYRFLFKIINFLHHFRQCLKLFYVFEKKLFMDFLEFPKHSRKTDDGL